MHSFVKPILMAAIACNGFASASAQQARYQEKPQSSSQVVPIKKAVKHHAVLTAIQDKPPMTDAATHATVLAQPPPTVAPAVTATVKQPPKPSVAQPASSQVHLDPAAAKAVSTFHLNTAALNAGSVKAVVDGRAEVVDSGNVAGKARRGALFITRTSAKATRTALPPTLSAALPEAAKASAVKLGYTLSTTAGPEGNPLRLVALVAVNNGLVLDAAHSVYRGSFSVALSNPDDPTDRRALNSPITMAITAAGASEVTPAPLDIADVGRWHPVSVMVPDFPGDTYRVAVSADPQDRGNAIELPVSKPTIQVIAAQTEIPGWGIGRTAVTVRARGLMSPEGYPVTLRNDHGQLDPMYVTLDARGMATASLRSDSAASTSVRVGDAGVVSEPATVVFAAPWLFLAAAVVGGLLGAFIRGKGRRHLWYALAIGVASAILMTLAYAVGIDWASRLLSAPQLATSGEAVVFVLGAIAALVGVGALLPAKTTGKGN